MGALPRDIRKTIATLAIVGIVAFAGIIVGFTFLSFPSNDIITTTITSTTTSTTTTTTNTTTTTTNGPENPPKIAIVLATGGLGDRAFNDLTYMGAEAAWIEYGWNFTYVEPTEISQYEIYLRNFAAHPNFSEPFELIICVGYDQAESLMEVASEYPSQKFAIIDYYIDPEANPNVASLLFSTNECAALAGAIAGLITESDSIAFIGGMDIDVINQWLAGYIFGAEYSNPGISSSVAYVNEWANPYAAESLADGIYTSGTDVIMTVAGYSNLGVFDSAKKNNDTYGPLWTIGADYPQMYLGCADPENPEPPTISPTTALKRVDVAVHSIIGEVFAGSFSGGVHLFNLSNEGVDYEINTDLLTLPGSVVSVVEGLKADIIAGIVTVPDIRYWDP
ncbi:MAG: BMP family protein [Candidatus Hodarchaeota archaeon]